jgi:hypothetical protein
MSYPFVPGSAVHDADFNDHRFASQKQPIVVPRTIAAGQNLAAGSVLGIVTSTHELKLSATASEDGSEVAKFVLTDAVDTTSGAVTGLVYAEAHLLSTFLVYGTGHSLLTVRDSLREAGITVSVPAY